MHDWIVFAEDTLSGNGGWAGAGLLGLVLAWLMLRHLPEKDRQLAELQAACDRRGEAQRGEFTAALRGLTDDHHKLVGEILDHCRQESERLLGRFTELTDKLERLADALAHA